MLVDYGYIALFLLVSLAFAGLMVSLPVALRWFKIVPHKPSAVKASTFECGLITIGRSWVQFNPHYYFYALVMVALDVMVIFIYPWAVVLGALGTSGLAAIFIFIGIISLGYAFAWRKGVLEWK